MSQVPDYRAEFTRASIVDTLKMRVADAKPILAVGASAGITAAAAEAAGADLVVVCAAGRARLRGIPTYQADNDNSGTLQMYAEIANVVDRTPLIGGVNATDPTYRRLPELVDRFQNAGFDGVINSPSVGAHPGELAYLRSHVGLGFDREIRLIEEAHKRDLLSVIKVYEPAQAALASEAGADVIVLHAHWTATGRPTPYHLLERSMDEAIDWLVEMKGSITSDAVVLYEGRPAMTPAESG